MLPMCVRPSIIGVHVENVSKIFRQTSKYISSHHNEEQFHSKVRPDVDGFGGLVVSMLAFGSRVRGFKPGRSPWILLYIKILSMSSFGGEVK
jgi:hypothetical protein